jgi:arylsulfatase A-like enzyme
MATYLHSLGYATGGFVSGPFLAADYGFARGFDVYDDYSLVDVTDPRGVGIDFGSVHRSTTTPGILRLAESWLAQTRSHRSHRPFFLFIHIFDVHYDYLPHPDTADFDPGYEPSVHLDNLPANPAINPRMNPRDLEHLVALYDGEIRFVDDHLGHLFAALRAAGLEDTTVVAVTSDHGEEFFEHGNKAHRSDLSDVQLKVPLVVRFPSKIPAGLVVNAQVRLADVAPTLLALAGVPAGSALPAQPGPTVLVGTNLEPSLRDARVPFPELPAYGRLICQTGDFRSYRTGTAKLVLRKTPASLREELYDLAADPGEATSIAERDPELVHHLRQLLEAASAAGGVKAPPALLEFDHLSRLRALGYL